MSSEDNSVGALIPLVVIGVVGILKSKGIEIIQLFEAIGSGVLIILKWIAWLLIFYLTVRLLFMGVNRLKKKIDSIFSWKDAVDKELKFLRDKTDLVDRDCYRINCKEEDLSKALKQLQADVSLLKEVTGITTKESVQKASDEILRDFA